MKTIMVIGLILFILAIAAFIGKISFVDGITIERPFTALAFIVTCIFAWINI